MNRRKILELIFHNPYLQISVGTAAFFVDLGAVIEERKGSRISIDLFGEVKVFHRPHPSPNTDKGAVKSVRRWLEANGVKP